MSSAMPLVVQTRDIRGWAKSLGALVLVLVLALLLASCASRGPAPVAGNYPAYGTPNRPALASARLTQVSWQQVEGWQDDTLIGAAAALRANCSKLAHQSDWARACAAAGQIDELD